MDKPNDFVKTHIKVISSLAYTGGISYFYNYINDFIPKSKPSLTGHIHSDYELYVNVTGDISFVVGDRRFMLTSGDAVLTKPNEPHFCIINSDCFHEHYCIWITEKSDSGILSCFDRTPGESVISLSKSGKKELLSLCAKLKEPLPENSVLPNSITFLSIINLLSEKRSESLLTDIPKEMQLILSVIDKNLMENIKISDLSKLCFISQSTLNRRFKTHIGISPQTYIETQRMALATEMFCKGASVQEVCNCIGYDDCSYFIRRFKKIFGCTPGQYKNNK